MNFKDNIKNNIENNIQANNTKYKNTKPIGNAKLVLSKKNANKINKKSIPLYLVDSKIKELDKICKKTGYSRNELLNILIDFGLDNLELDLK